MDLRDLIGKEVCFKYYVLDDNEEDEYKETKGIVNYAYIDEFNFYMRWNEPLSLVIGFKPLSDISIYKNIDEEDFIDIFNDDYSIESITEILN